MAWVILVVVTVCVALAAPVHATTVLWAGGTSGSLGRLVPPGLFGTPDQLLGGVYRDDPTTTVNYPASLWPVTGLLDPTLGKSVSIGTAALVAAARTTPGPLVVVGVSQGAMVVQYAQAALDGDPTVPSETTFVLIADPNLGLVRSLHGVYVPILDYTPAAPAQTRFTTIVVTNEYDGFADPIKRPWNLLADLNALLGIVYVHPTAQNADLSTVAAADITTTANERQGTTIEYRVRTRHLPLTMPLRQLGVPDGVVDGIDARLRPVIDQGYLDPAPNRPKRPASTARASTAASASATEQVPGRGSPRATGRSGHGVRQLRHTGP